MSRQGNDKDGMQPIGDIITMSDLPKRIKRESRLTGIAQVRGDEPRKAKTFIQLTHQNQAGVGGDARPLKRDLQKPVERELKGRGL